MTDTTTLRQLAEAATPGPWEHKQPFMTVSRQRTIHGTVPAQRVDYVAAGGRVVIPMEGRENTASSADMAYIAAMHPETTLALLDRLARQSALCAAMAKWLHWSDLPDDAVVLAGSGEGAFCITAGMIREATR